MTKEEVKEIVQDAIREALDRNRLLTNFSENLKNYKSKGIQHRSIHFKLI